MHELWTVGRIARETGCRPSKIQYILTRDGISETQRAGVLRLFDSDGVAKIRASLAGTGLRRRSGAARR